MFVTPNRVFVTSIIIVKYVYKYNPNRPERRKGLLQKAEALNYFNYFRASSTATATETVMPTMGLLPAPRKPIISTWAGTEEEPAN